MHVIPFFSIIILALDTKIKKEAKKKSYDARKRRGRER
jgi:hypothetical protein